jgi:Transposase IS116/IS110/IS902 family
LIDDLDAEIDLVNRKLRLSDADHPYVPLLLTVPGVGWVLAFTIAGEIGDIHRFASPTKLCGYTGLCPRVNQSGEKDRRGPLTKQGPRYLRWAMLEATMHALRHPAYADRYQQTKRRLGKQRGAKVAQIDIARRLTEAVWHMLSRNQPGRPPRTLRDTPPSFIETMSGSELTGGAERGWTSRDGSQPEDELERVVDGALLGAPVDLGVTDGDAGREPGARPRNRPRRHGIRSCATHDRVRGRPTGVAQPCATR